MASPRRGGANNSISQLAERVGFEPTDPEGSHALQACLIGHSSTSPRQGLDAQRGGLLRQKGRPSVSLC